jgi:arylsulfatase A-like enzyme
MYRSAGSAVALVAALGAAGCSKDAPPAQPGSQTPTVAAASSAAPAAAARAVATSSATGATSVASAAPPPAPPGPPKDCNVIVLSVDALRADMPWNGYPRAIAPRLTELEKKAVHFTHAYSVSSYTSMSLGGLLGGRYPSELQRSGYFFGTYKNDVFFPKLLQKAGVHTMGVMAHMYFKAAGFDQGFDEWKIVPGIAFDPNTDRDITSLQSEQLAEQELGEAANESQRFFFWAHFVDPHDLYLRHDGIDWGKSDRDRYDGEVQFTDQALGKLLDFIASKPWASRTVIVITADHGEEFGEHNMTRHGFEVWDTLVHVPLMFVAPGATPRRVDVPRSAIDLAPTITELYGVAPEPSFEGKSLVSEIYGAPSEPRDILVDLPMTSDNARRRALVHGSEKLICFDTDSYCKLFDLAKDPMEKDPITKGDDYKDMKERYRAMAKTLKEVTPYACSGDCLNSTQRRMQAAKGTQ